MHRSASSVLGIVIIVIGVASLLANFGVIYLSWETFWPVLILGIGLVFELSYFAGDRGNAGLLVPGGIFLTVGIVFTVCVFIGWEWVEILWPLFVLAPAVGLIQFYLFGTRERALLIPVGVLGSVGLIALLINLQTFKVASLVGSVLLLAIGAMLITGSGRRR